MIKCDRCGTDAEKLYDLQYKGENDYGDEELIKIQICWSCDHDISNGGDIVEDAAEILADRAERDYEYDPINNPRPY